MSHTNQMDGTATFEGRETAPEQSVAGGRPLPSGVLANVATGLLLLSLAALATAPLLMPDSYSWMTNTVSDSGGQGVEGAWLFRSVVLLTVAGVLTLVGLSRDIWGPWGQAVFVTYALALIAATVFAEAPWDGAPYDQTEAFFHTVAAFSAGAAFLIGVITVGRRRSAASTTIRVCESLLVVGMVTLPLLMLVFTAQTGLLQRALVLAGYAWLLHEAIRIGKANTRRSRVQPPSIG